MDFPELHPWPTSPAAAIRLQANLRHRVRLVPFCGRPRVVAGADCAFSSGGRTIVAFVAAFVLPGLREIARAEASAPVRFPYVPGLLSFREAPVLLRAFRRLDAEPEVVLFDGQGIAHPRRLGLATHIGLWLDRPTVGCAKSRLTGRHRGEPAIARGSYRTLYDGHEPIGRVVRTRDRVKPLYVSPGHRMDIPSAMRITLACGAGYRLPEPTRVADHEVGRAARRTL